MPPEGAAPEVVQGHLMVSADSVALGVRRPGLELRLCPQWLVTLGKVMEFSEPQLLRVSQEGLPGIVMRV